MSECYLMLLRDNFGHPGFGDHGSQYFHTTLKFKDAPTEEVGPVKDLVAYTDKHIMTPSI